MTATELSQAHGIEALHPQRDSVDPGRLEHPQTLGVDVLGVELDRPLGASRHVPRRRDPREQPPQVVRPENAGRSSPDVDRRRTLPLPDIVSVLDLAVECIDEHSTVWATVHTKIEVAVGTRTRAERHVHVDAKLRGGSRRGTSGRAGLIRGRVHRRHPHREGRRRCRRIRRDAPPPRCPSTTMLAAHPCRCRCLCSSDVCSSSVSSIDG